MFERIKHDLSLSFYQDYQTPLNFCYVYIFVILYAAKYYIQNIIYQDIIHFYNFVFLSNPI